MRLWWTRRAEAEKTRPLRDRVSHEVVRTNSKIIEMAIANLYQSSLEIQKIKKIGIQTISMLRENGVQDADDQIIELYGESLTEAGSSLKGKDGLDTLHKIFSQHIDRLLDSKSLSHDFISEDARRALLNICMLKKTTQEHLDAVLDQLIFSQSPDPSLKTQQNLKNVYLSHMPNPGWVDDRLSEFRRALESQDIQTSINAVYGDCAVEWADKNTALLEGIQRQQLTFPTKEAELHVSVLLHPFIMNVVQEVLRYGNTPPEGNNALNSSRAQTIAHLVTLSFPATEPSDQKRETEHAQKAADAISGIEAAVRKTVNRTLVQMGGDNQHLR